LHHAKYFQTDNEAKLIKELKSQVLLRREKNSKVLKVTKIENPREFDKVIDQVVQKKQPFNVNGNSGKSSA